MDLFLILIFLGFSFTLIVHFNLVPLNIRYLFLLILIFGILYSIKDLGINYADLGFRPPTLSSIIAYSVVTFIGWATIGCTDIRDMVLGRKVANNKYIENFLFYVVISAPLQELNARCYPFAIFKYFEWNGLLFVLFSSLIFAFSHIFLKNNYLTLFTFLMSLAWSTTFYFYPDFLSLSLSHAILGLVLFTPRSSSPFLRFPSLT